jgi:hypothetical protein
MEEDAGRRQARGTINARPAARTPFSLLRAAARASRKHPARRGSGEREADGSGTREVPSRVFQRKASRNRAARASSRFTANIATSTRRGWRANQEAPATAAHRGWPRRRSRPRTSIETPARTRALKAR